jgi:hypothetical protein
MLEWNMEMAMEQATLPWWTPWPANGAWSDHAQAMMRHRQQEAHYLPFLLLRNQGKVFLYKAALNIHVE